MKSDPEASRALLKLSASPERAVAFLKTHLAPLTTDAGQVNKWIKDLESDDDDVWKPAFEKLSYFDPRLVIELGSLMADVMNGPARSRLVAILTDHPADTYAGKDVSYRTFPGGQNFVIGNGSFWAEPNVSRLANGQPKAHWTRAVRAVVLLEHIGSLDAIAIIKDMSTGHADAAPTTVAASALEKLEAKK